MQIKISVVKWMSKLLFVYLLVLSNIHVSAQQPMGLGIAKPQLKAGTVLYLYSGQLVDDLLSNQTIKDSIMIVQGNYNLEISSAPSWFYPELQKLDYDLLYLRVVTVSRNWIEVIVNQKTGRTAWIDHAAVELVYLPDFLLGVYGVEVTNAAANPVRSKPMDNASTVMNPGRNSLRPIAIQGEWMKVATIQEDEGAVPKLGWIRWRKGNQLLISWSVLS